MAAGWTLDKIGPMWRYAEDCAIVLHAIAVSDGLDLAVPEGIPFAWDAAEKLNGRKVGYIPAFVDAETDVDIRSSYDRAIAVLKTAGCRLQPVDVPRSDLNVISNTPNAPPGSMSLRVAVKTRVFVAQPGQGNFARITWSVP
jgi:Asp-tRNA(Asn)/Glu-tRNA(Gln) amidotransferase A subunit family amidase